MMNARLNKALVALLAVAAVGACDDPPVDVSVNEASRLHTNPSFVIIEAGESRLVQSFLVNDVGIPVSGDVDFEACNSLITVADDPDQADVEPGTNFVITGVTLGESCVNVSAGGFERTIGVRVVPAQLVATVTPNDTLRAGSTGSIDVFTATSSGAAVGPFEEGEATFTSSNTARVFMTDTVGAFDTRQSGGAIVTVTHETFGVTRTLQVPITVLPAPPATGAFAAASFPGVAVGDTVSIAILLRDSVANLNNLDVDIDSIRLTSSNTGVATAFATIEPNEDDPSLVVMTANAVGVSSGTSDITGTAYTVSGPISLGTSRVTVLAPNITTIAPTTGQAGDVVVISGTGFTATGFTTLVFMDNTDITMFVDATTATAITLDMPGAVANGNHDIYVRVGGVSSDTAIWNQTSTQDTWGPENETRTTAPLITLPADLVGTHVGANNVDHYAFTLAVRSAVTVRLNWPGAKDLDVLFRTSTGSFVTATGCTAAASAAHPETATCTLDPGTYTLHVEDYSSSHDGDASLISYELRVSAVAAP